MCIGSRPDSFQGGTYNLQSISATPEESGLVHETRLAAIENTVSLVSCRDSVETLLALHNWQ